VEQDGSRTVQATDDVHDGDGQDQQQHGTKRSIRPGTVVPPTVLMANMGTDPCSSRVGRTDPARI
jgi:hypothetical protein